MDNRGTMHGAHVQKLGDPNDRSAKPIFDAKAYLAWEAMQLEKHEYIAGRVFAMAGASDARVTIGGNVFATLRAHLRGSSCRA